MSTRFRAVDQQYSSEAPDHRSLPNKPHWAQRSSNNEAREAVEIEYAGVDDYTNQLALDQNSYEPDHNQYEDDGDQERSKEEDYQEGYEAELERSKKRVLEAIQAKHRRLEHDRQRQPNMFAQNNNYLYPNQSGNADGLYQPQQYEAGRDEDSYDPRQNLAEWKQYSNDDDDDEAKETNRLEEDEDNEGGYEQQQRLIVDESSNELGNFDESQLRYQDDALQYSESTQGNNSVNRFTNLNLMSKGVVNKAITGSQLIAQIKEDESYIENSHDQHDLNDQSYNRETQKSSNQLQARITEMSETDKQASSESQRKLELIKHSKYYAKYLNGESLNDSYSMLQSQTNQQLHSSTTMQNTTMMAALSLQEKDASIDQTYTQKVKLMQTNCQLVNEMSKNKQLMGENAEIKAQLDELRLQLNEQAHQMKQNENHNSGNMPPVGSQTAIMMNTFGSPLKSPSFDPAQHSSENPNGSGGGNVFGAGNNNKATSFYQKESANHQQAKGTYSQGISTGSVASNYEQQQMGQKLEEERGKNAQLRADLEALRTRLLAAMNSLNQADYITRDQERVIASLQENVKQKDQIVQEKTEENRKLFANTENFRVEAQTLQGKLKKAIQGTEEMEAIKRQAESEVATLKVEVKGLQTKLVNFTQDNNRLFSEIQSLKIKLEKADSAAHATQNSLFAQRADRPTSPAPARNALEVNELKASLSSLTKQLAIQHERNSFLEARMAEMQDSIAQQAYKQHQKSKNEYEESIDQRQIEVEIDLRNRQAALQREYDQVSHELQHRQQQQLHKKTIPQQQQQQQTKKQLWQHQQPQQKQTQKKHFQVSEEEFDQIHTGGERDHRQNSGKQVSQNVRRHSPESPQIKKNYEQPNNTINNKTRQSNLRNQAIPQSSSTNNLYYTNLEAEKQRLQSQPDFIPIGVTSVNENTYLSHSQKVKQLDQYLNELLQEKRIVESDLLKLEENKRKSSQLFNHKTSLETRLTELSSQISQAKNHLRELNALK